MKKERVTIEGGRYLIYYTFDDELPAARADAAEESQASPPGQIATEPPPNDA